MLLAEGAADATGGLPGSEGSTSTPCGGTSGSLMVPAKHAVSGLPIKPVRRPQLSPCQLLQWVCNQVWPQATAQRALAIAGGGLCFDAGPTGFDLSGLSHRREAGTRGALTFFSVGLGQGQVEDVDLVGLGWVCVGGAHVLHSGDAARVEAQHRQLRLPLDVPYLPLEETRPRLPAGHQPCSEQLTASKMFHKPPQPCNAHSLHYSCTRWLCV